MSQTPPATGEQPRRSRFRWIWILLALMIFPPMLLAVVLIAVYLVHDSRMPVQAEQMARAQALAEYQKRLAEDQRQLQAAQARVQMAAQKVQAHVVRVQISFEDLETRFTNALIVEREGSVSHLTATKDAFAPMTGKVNGRAVTRQPSNIQIAGNWSGAMMGGGAAGPGSMGMQMMPGATPMGSGGAPYALSPGILIGRELPELGLVVLKTSERLSPLRVLGDFTRAEVGEKLSVISVDPAQSNGSEVAVLGTDESVSIAPGKTLNHVLKLTAWNGELGTIVCNSRGDPIAQIVATTTIGKMTYSYAVPMDRLFGALYRDVDSPESRMDDLPPGFPLTAEMLPVDNGVRPGDDVSVGIPQRTDGPIVPSAIPRTTEPPTPEPFRGPDEVPEVRPTGKVDRPASDPPLPVAEKGGQSPPSAALPAIDEGDTLDDQAHRKEPRRTRIIKIPGRKLEDIAKILTSLFGAKADVAIDEPGGAVLVTINRAETWGEVQFLLAEIDATASRLAQPNQAEFAKLVDEFNELFRTGRFSQAVVIAKRAKELVPDSVQADMMLSKSQLAVRVAPAPDAEGKPPMGTAGGLSKLEGLSSGLATPGASSDGAEKSLEAESRELALRLRTAAPAEAPALRKRLEELTQRHFEVRQQRRKQEIEELGTRVDKLRLGHLRREQNKSEVIQRRIKELLDPNTDLRWDDASNGKNRSPVLVSPTSVSATRSIPENAPDDSVPTATTVDATVPGGNVTFDGVGYPQWLTLLETERKPEKLATAIEACSRLADVADVPRITRGILHAAHLFEEAELNEQEQVWSAAADGLNRLSPEVVTDELILALQRHDDDYRGGYFQAQYLTMHAETSTRKIAASKIQELIGALLKVEPNDIAIANLHLAAACRVWQFTDRPIDDYADLRPAVVTLIDEGESRHSAWRTVVGVVVAKWPQMPDLAMKLLPRADGDESLWTFIGNLKAHAEPAVPLIVERFVKRWQKGEDEMLALARKGIVRPSDSNRFTIEYVRTLGEIGIGPKGWQLLSELRAIRRQQLGPQTATVLDMAIARFQGPHESDSKSLLLSDYSMISGEWRLKEIAPGTAPTDYLLSFNRRPLAIERLDTSPKLEFSNGVIDFFSHDGGQSFELDTQASPKRITLISHGFGMSVPETRREGIYELTTTTLRLQFPAGINQPPPKEFATPASLPEGEVLLEFSRKGSDEAEFSAPRR